MKKTNRVPLAHKKDTMPLPTTYQPLETRARFRGRSEEDLLLRHPNFVAKLPDASFEAPPLACEASTLTTELTALNHIYFSPKFQLCKAGRTQPIWLLEKLELGIYNLRSLLSKS